MPAGATNCKFAGLVGDEAHVRQHVSHSLWVCLRHNGNACGKGGDPCRKCPVPSDLSLAWRLWRDQARRESGQPFGQRNVIGKKFPHVNKLQRLNALYQLSWNRHNAARHFERCSPGLGISDSCCGYRPVSVGGRES